MGLPKEGLLEGVRNKQSLEMSIDDLGAGYRGQKTTPTIAAAVKDITIPRA